MSDCIEFDGYREKTGYGRIGLKVNGQWKRLLAHRVAYAEACGPIPDGLCVCHKCDNPSCVNVDHLFLGTYADNNRDRESKGRSKMPNVKGSAHGLSKLTEQDIPRIRDMLRIGCKQRDIAKWFGVCEGVISKIKLGKRWGHIA